jgi:glucosamine--fructose-6-phosphate aminotransferase (isomerizing)
MFEEAGEAAAAVERQRALNRPVITALGAKLQTMAPHLLFTCARGSSDHAATFAKYLFETRLGVATLSVAPSIASIYGRTLPAMKGQLFLAISQSGRSPDLLRSCEAAREAGALVIALLNDTAAPLADLADVVVPLQAGPELSVAATKSFIASLAALIDLAAAWSGDATLESAQAALPYDLANAWRADWGAALPLFGDAPSMLTLGRGFTSGVAQEAALKFKETSGIHAEAFSLAEVAHGPMALVKRGYPVLVFAPQDQAAKGMDGIVQKFVTQGARVAVAGAELPGALTLPVASNLHPAAAPLIMAQSFYRLAHRIALARGLDPDQPPLLRKVTETQ